MDIKITIGGGDDFGERSEEMEINGRYSCSVGPLCECPEDAIIGRSLISCEDIAALMKRAHAAGAAGEEFKIELVKEEN